MFNGFGGVTVQNDENNEAGDHTDRNTIRGNRISRNAQRGIDLITQPEPTPNDSGDADEGPNALQNFPVGVSSYVDPETNVYTVSGVVDAPNPQSLTIDIYGGELQGDPNDDPDASGFGEGYEYVTTVKACNEPPGPWSDLDNCIAKDGSFQIRNPPGTARLVHGHGHGRERQHVGVRPDLRRPRQQRQHRQRRRRALRRLGDEGRRLRRGQPARSTAAPGSLQREREQEGPVRRGGLDECVLPQPPAGHRNAQRRGRRLRGGARGRHRAPSDARRVGRRGHAVLLRLELRPRRRRRLLRHPQRRAGPAAGSRRALRRHVRHLGGALGSCHLCEDARGEGTRIPLRDVRPRLPVPERSRRQPGTPRLIKLGGSGVAEFGARRLHRVARRLEPRRPDPGRRRAENCLTATLCRRSVEAGTFMHELGHTIGLGHGGLLLGGRPDPERTRTTSRTTSAS